MPDQSEFEALVREHQAMVFRTLLRLTGSREHLEDLAQEVFLRLYRGLLHFRGEAKISTYLYRITYNVAQDEWKRRQSEQGIRSLSEPISPHSDDAAFTLEDRIASPGRNAEQMLSRTQLGAQIEQALASLADLERSALVLYHQEECSYDQIAEILHLPINTVRTHIHRGRQKLKQRLQSHLQPLSIESPKALISGKGRVEPCVNL